MRMTDDEAHERFKAIRFADNGGAAFCPRCECTAVYTYAARRIWKCKGCGHQFSVTSGTIFASRKLPIRDYLAAIAIFVNAVKGISALQLGRDLDVQYKTAFVLAHKLREAIGADQTEAELSGMVEIDGAYVGGHSSRKTRRPTARTAGWPRNRPASGSQSWSPASAAAGRSRSWLPRKAMHPVHPRAIVLPGTVVHADEAPGWDRLHAFYEMMRINHSHRFQHGRRLHQLGRVLLLPPAPRRVGPAPPHQRQVPDRLCPRDGVERGYPAPAERALHEMATGAALAHPVSRVWAGYWQRGAN